MSAPIQPYLTREMLMVPQVSTWNSETRTMDAVIAAGARGVQRDRETGELYDELLLATPGCVDTSRVDSGCCPFVDAHGELFLDLLGESKRIITTKSVIGRIVEGSIRYENGTVVATIYLTTAEDAQPIVQRILDGTIKGISVGYQPLSWTDSADGFDGRKLRTVATWLLFEVSATAIPLDRGAHIRTAAPDEVRNMAEVQNQATVESQITAARAEGERAAASRMTGIMQIATRAGLNLNAAPAADESPAAAKIRAGFADPAYTPEMATRDAFEMLATRTETHEVQGAGAQITRDATETMIRGLEAALTLRAGMAVEDKADLEMAAAYRADSLMDLGRRCLEAHGIRTLGLSRTGLARAILRQSEGVLIQRAGGHVTGDFAGLTAAITGKALKAERTVTTDYNWFEKIGSRVDLPDYKARTVVDIGGLGLLPEVKEGAEYQRVTFGEDSVAWHLIKRGAEIAMTEEMILNDDLNGFMRLVRMWVRSAIQSKSVVAANAIFSNPVMGDGKALFTAGDWNWSKNKKTNNGGHANLVAAGGAPSPARLAAGDLALRDQVDRDGAVIGSPARFFLGGSNWVTPLEALYSEHYRPTTPADAVTVPLDKGSRIYIPSLKGTTPWVLVSGDNLGFEFGGLQGEGGPIVLEYADVRADSRVFHCRDVFGCRVVDPRPFFMDAGATQG